MTGIEHVEAPALDGYDPTDPMAFVDPYPHWARARSECPVFYSPILNYWQITRYADIAAVARTPEIFSSEGFFSTINIHPGNEELIPKGLAMGTPSLVNADPPVHTRTRAISDPAFRKSRVTALESTIRATADELIDRFVTDGRVELVEAYSVPLPLITIAHVLGVPADDYHLGEMRRYSDEVVASVDPQMSAEQQRELFEHYGGFYDFCLAAIDEARRDRGDTILSALVAEAERDADGGLSDEVLVSIVATLIFGGNEATRNMITGVTHALLRHPDQLDQVRRDPELAAAAVEETLRHKPSFPGLFRIVTRDTSVDGVDLPAGSVVQLCWASAGRDDSVFADPDSFDIHRPNANKHVSFGRGAHVCLGAPLARLELKIAVQQLVARLPDLRLVREPEAPAEYMISPAVMGVRRLEVAWSV